MEAAPLKKSQYDSHLKVIKNHATKTIEDTVKRIYINTLSPGFSYEDKNGIAIMPKKCILL